jgi:hypothetical protein
MPWTLLRNCLLVLVAALSLLPQPWKGRLATVGLLHDGLHVGAFFALAALTFKLPGTLWRSLRACGLLFLFAVTLEFLQTRRYHNRLEIFDILADLTGIALAALIFAIYPNPCPSSRLN